MIRKFGFFISKHRYLGPGLCWMCVVCVVLRRMLLESPSWCRTKSTAAWLLRTSQMPSQANKRNSSWGVLRSTIKTYQNYTYLSSNLSEKNAGSTAQKMEKRGSLQKDLRHVPSNDMTACHRVWILATERTSGTALTLLQLFSFVWLKGGNMWENMSWRDH